MAKLCYFVICYKEDLEKFGMTIEELSSDIQKYGAETFYILHDKDKAKPHYHFCAGFKKSPMPWKNEFRRTKKGKLILVNRGFSCWMRQHCCISPKRFKDGHVDKYSCDKATVRDIDACINYCTHGGGLLDEGLEDGKA